MLIDTAPQLGLAGASDPPTLPACVADQCPAVRFTWTLTTPYQLDATVAVTLPEGLELLSGSVSGAEVAGPNRLRFSGTVPPDTPHHISYQARPHAGSRLLITTVSATTPGAPPVERSLALAQPAEQTGTLVMIYASGDNNLHDAMLDLAIHAERGAATKNVAAVLLLDGPGPDDAYLYQLQPGQRDCFGRLLDPTCGGRYTLGQTYWKWPDSLASSDTLTTFLVAMQQRYPAAHRVLSLVGHGGGWSPTVLDGQPSRHGGQPSGDLGGMLWDDHPAASLSTAELAQALRASEALTRNKLDLVFLDACAMGQIEVAYELRETARYLLVSPNWKWAAFPYDEHLRKAAVGDGLKIGQAWLANETAALTAYPDEPYTYTLLDLKQIETLRTRVNELAVQLMRQQREAVRTALRQPQVDRYDSDQNGMLDTNDSALDLDSLATQLASSFALDAQVVGAAEQVRTALRGSVLEHRVRGGQPWPFQGQNWSWPTSAGLSIYLPVGQKDDWRRRYYRTLAFGNGSAWADLIDWLWNQNPPDDEPCTAPCKLPPGLLFRRQTYLPLLRR